MFFIITIKTFLGQDYRNQVVLILKLEGFENKFIDCVIYINFYNLSNRIKQPKTSVFVVGDVYKYFLSQYTRHQPFGIPNSCTGCTLLKSKSWPPLRLRTSSRYSRSKSSASNVTDFRASINMRARTALSCSLGRNCKPEKQTIWSNSSAFYHKI